MSLSNILEARPELRLQMRRIVIATADARVFSPSLPSAAQNLHWLDVSIGRGPSQEVEHILRAATAVSSSLKVLNVRGSVSTTRNTDWSRMLVSFSNLTQLGWNFPGARFASTGSTGPTVLQHLFSLEVGPGSMDSLLGWLSECRYVFSPPGDHSKPTLLMLQFTETSEPYFRSRRQSRPKQSRPTIGASQE